MSTETIRGGHQTIPKQPHDSSASLTVASSSARADHTADRPLTGLALTSADLTPDSPLLCGFATDLACSGHNILSEMPVHEFKRRVSRWANQFDSTYRTLLWTIGNHMDFQGVRGPIGTWKLTIPQIQGEMRKWMIQQGDADPWVPAYSTIKRYLAELRDAEVLRTERTWYRSHGRNRRGGNRYQVNFHAVLLDGATAPHDFMEPLTPPTSPAAALRWSVTAGSEPVRATGPDGGQVVVDPATEPDVGPNGEPNCEPMASPISSPSKSQEEVSKESPQASTACVQRKPVGASEVALLRGHESDLDQAGDLDEPDEADDEDLTWAEFTGIEDLNETLFDTMLDGLRLGRVAAGYAVETFLNLKQAPLQRADNPAGWLTTVMPRWWADNKHWVQTSFDEEYPSDEMFAEQQAAEEASLISEKVERESVAEAKRRAKEQQDRQDAHEQRVANLDWRYNNSGSIFDFEKLLEDYTEDALLAGINSLQEDLRQGRFPYSGCWEESVGGEAGLRRRLEDMGLAPTS